MLGFAQKGGMKDIVAAKLKVVFSPMPTKWILNPSPMRSRFISAITAIAAAAAYLAGRQLR